MSETESRCKRLDGIGFTGKEGAQELFRNLKNLLGGGVLTSDLSTDGVLRLLKYLTPFFPIKTNSSTQTPSIPKDAFHSFDHKVL
jgi:hypothetical protein